MSSPIQRLGQVSQEYQRRADAYLDIAVDAARAEADYRRMKAVAMFRATNDGASAAKAEIIADSSDDVSAACMSYKVTAAIADAAQKKLAQLREQVAVGRSVLVSDREVDKLHSQGISGAA